MEFQKFRPVHNPKNYPSQLYLSELNIHSQIINEYPEIHNYQESQSKFLKPNLNLIKQQPELSLNFRLKLIDFLLKISTKLKIIPFVFFKAVKLFDRYCSKRIVLTDQAQLVICTCLWLSAKLVGGCNHFIYSSSIPTGGRFNGPSQRSRIPKLNEFVKLCGKSCNYDEGMFVQMELHILQTLNWEVNDASIEEFLVSSNEFYNGVGLDTMEYEIFKIKEYLSYVSLYCNELIDVNLIELSNTIKQVINESLGLSPFDSNYQIINSEYISENSNIDIEMDYPISPISPTNFEKNSLIKSNLMKSLLNSSEFLLSIFNSSGPKQVYIQSIDKLSTSKNQQFNSYNKNFTVTTPTNTITNIDTNQQNPPQQEEFFYKNNNDSNLFDYIVNSTSYFKVSTPIQKFSRKNSNGFILTPPNSSKNSPRSIRSRILG